MKIDWPHRGHAYSKKEIDAVVEIMSNPKIQLTQGSCVSKFEEDFMNYLGSKNAFSLMSAAHGLDISANLIEIQKGDEVIIPEPFYANYNGFAHASDVKVIPITSKIEDNFALPSIDLFRDKINNKTKAIITGICTSLLAGAAKEVYDNSQGGIFDKRDILATGMGGVFVTFTIPLFQKKKKKKEKNR